MGTRQETKRSRHLPLGFPRSRGTEMRSGRRLLQLFRADLLPQRGDLLPVRIRSDLAATPLGSQAGEYFCVAPTVFSS